MLTNSFLKALLCVYIPPSKIGKKDMYGIVSVMVGGTKQSTYCYEDCQEGEAVSD